jgi:hypothetical protein
MIWDQRTAWDDLSGLVDILFQLIFLKASKLPQKRFLTKAFDTHLASRALGLKPSQFWVFATTMKLSRMTPIFSRI